MGLLLHQSFSARNEHLHAIIDGRFNSAAFLERIAVLHPIPLTFTTFMQVLYSAISSELMCNSTGQLGRILVETA